MGDQDVRPLGHEGPFFGERGAARQVEGPIVVRRLPRAPPKGDAVDRGARVLEIDEIGDERARLGLVLDEREVVIAGDDDLRPVREAPHPEGALAKLLEAPAAAHVARVDEDVALRDDELVVKEVRVGDCDDAHRLIIAW